jgi:hypothetical protein
MAEVGRAHAHSVIPSASQDKASEGCQCILLRLGRLAHRRVTLLLIRVGKYAGAAGAIPDPQVT